jgi:NADH-quinone oxidoreductase subunit H
MSATVDILVRLVLTLVVVMSCAGMLVWVERRLLAAFQDRYGPNRVGPFGLFQLVADGIKLFTKEDWVPPFADRVPFVLAPAIIVFTALLSFAVVPFAATGAVVDLNVGLLLFLALSSVSVYSIMLAGMSSNSKYALLGSVRAAAQMVSYELAMGISLASVVLLAGSFNLSEIVAAQSGIPFVVLQPVAFAIFVIAGFAESKRSPFDIPEAENELVAGFHTEYSSMKFAFFMFGEYLALVLFSSIATATFLGGGSGPWLPPLVWFALKVACLLYLFIWVRATFPRVRYDRLMAFGWKVLVPVAILNLLVTGAFVVANSTGG